METLRKKAMGQRSGVMVMMVVIAVVIMAITKFAGIRSLFVHELTGDSDFEKMEGQYVHYVMKAPMDYYETITDGDNNTVRQYGYLVYDMDGAFFFGVMRPAKLETEMDAMIEQLWDYWYDEAESAPKSVHIYGTLTEMDYQDSGFFDDCLDYYAEYGITADAKYYYIDEGYMSGENVSTAKVMTVIGMALIVFGIIFWLWGNKSWDKNLKKYVEKHPEYSFSQLQAEIEGGRKFNNGNTVIGQRWIFQADSVIRIIETDQLCWGYYYHRSGRNSVSQMRLYDALGKLYTITASEKNTKEMLQYLYEQLPYIVVGFDKDWEKLFSKQKEQFFAIRYYDGKRQVKEQNEGGYAEKETAAARADKPEPETAAPEEPQEQKPWVPHFPDDTTEQ
jgi:hypothetical protein